MRHAAILISKFKLEYASIQDLTVKIRLGRLKCQTDVQSIAVIDPNACSFRNYQKANYTISTEELVLDKVQLLTLHSARNDCVNWWTKSININFDNSNNSKTGALVTC